VFSWLNIEIDVSTSSAAYIEWINLVFFYSVHVVIWVADTENTSLLHSRKLPSWLIAELRSDHAGEMGAVYIYKGILRVTRDTRVRQFATQHLNTEVKHLELMETLIGLEDQSIFIPLWRLAGFFTGAIPALFGANAIYATIHSVETFVDKHYQQQIDRLLNDAEHIHLAEAIEACRQDEVQHRDEAMCFLIRSPGPLLRAWCWLVGFGSSNAVAVARWR